MRRPETDLSGGKRFLFGSAHEFALVVINLGRIPKGLGEGEEFRELRRWARLLRARTWKEAVEVAEPYGDMREAVVTMYEMSQEEVIRNQCLARILYQGDMSGAREEGRQLEKKRLGGLIKHLVTSGRLEDLMRASEDVEYQETLLEELGL